jgi:hypothetical protein
VARRIGFSLFLATAYTLVVVPVAYAAPANDDPSGAVMVTGVPYTDTTDTTDATAGAEDECGAATVWYSFTPDVDGTYAVTTEGSDYDTTLAAYAGDPSGSDAIACNDDTPIGLTSALQLDLEAGTTYYFEAGTCCGPADPGTVGPGGTLVFNVYEAPAPLTAEVTVTRVTTDRAGSFTVTGTITCSQDGYFYLEGEVRQTQGLNIVRPGFYAEGTCGAEATVWTFSGSTGDRVLLTKRAVVSGSYGVCGAFECIYDTFQQALRVKRDRG